MNEDSKDLYLHHKMYINMGKFEMKETESDDDDMQTNLEDKVVHPETLGSHLKEETPEELTVKEEPFTRYNWNEDSCNSSPSSAEMDCTGPLHKLNKQPGKEPRIRRSRKSLSFETKLKILDRLSSTRESISAVSRAFNISESTIRTIRSSEQKIRQTIAASPASFLKKTAYRRSPVMERMESALAIWIQDQIQRRAPIDGPTIRAKARVLHERMLLEEPVNSDQQHASFDASKGWFDRFRKRQQLPNLTLTGEMTSPDGEAAASFSAQFRAFITAQGYSPHQVFNANKTLLFWKRMPTRTYIAKEEKRAPGFKAARDRVSLLLCSNAAGDFKCRPLVVYRALLPRALKGLSQSALPVHWRANQQAWVTTGIIQDWFMDCFCPEVEDYCRGKGVAFKALLLIYDAPGYLPSLADLHPSVRVMFLPANTSSLIQPLDQGAIAQFKRWYVKKVIMQVLEASEYGVVSTVKEFWRSYNILQAIKNIATCWQELKKKTLNSVWWTLWPEVVHDFKSLPDSHVEVEELVELGRNIGGKGFDDMEADDLRELLESHREELSTEDLLAITKEEQRTNKRAEVCDELATRDLTVEKLGEALGLANQLREIFFLHDPNFTRSLEFARRLDKALTPYTKLCKKMQNSTRSASKSTVANSNADPSIADTGHPQEASAPSKRRLEGSTPQPGEGKKRQT